MKAAVFTSCSPSPHSFSSRVAPSGQVSRRKPMKVGQSCRTCSGFCCPVPHVQSGVWERPILYMWAASLQWPIWRQKMVVWAPRPRNFSQSSPGPAWLSLHFSQKWCLIIVFAWEKEMALDGWSIVVPFFAKSSAFSLPESPQ